MPFHDYEQSARHTEELLQTNRRIGRDIGKCCRANGYEIEDAKPTNEDRWDASGKTATNQRARRENIK